MIRLIERALDYETSAIAELVTLFEDARDSARAGREAALTSLARHPRRHQGPLVGITGAPGSGKSTLIGQVALAIAGRREERSVGVIAVDPSSPFSGGAFLGDRVRVRFPPGQRRLFFRSQASASQWGGLGPSTFQVCRLMHHLFDVVFVETVGVGQGECDVRGLVDRLYLVVSPLGGDEIQVLKAGIMEIPDVVVVSKCDEALAAHRMVRTLEALRLPRSLDRGVVPRTLRTSASTGEGVAALAEEILTFCQEGSDDLAPKEQFFFSRWVRGEWGRRGERILEEALGGAERFLAEWGGYDRAQVAFESAIRGVLG